MTAPRTTPAIPAHVRSYAYSVLLAAVPILIVYGILDEATAALWVGLAGAVLGLGTAVTYRPTRHPEGDPHSTEGPVDPEKYPDAWD